MKPLVTMRAALSDPDLFGNVLAGESWAAWRVLLIAAMGEALGDEERVIFESLTARSQEPGKRVDEFWAIKGRRAGGTRAAGVFAAYVAAFCDHADVLAPGERAVLPILSASLWQAGKAFQFLDGIFSTVAALNRLVSGQTSDTISLSNGVDVECRPASFRTIRGVTAAAFVADELAYWRNDETSRNPDKEILDAARPALATTGGMLWVISSPYAKRGELWSACKRDFSPAGDPLILVAKGASRDFNPTLPQRVVDRAYERDPAAARAEFGGEFRDDVAGFLDFALVEAAVDRGVTVRPPRPGVQYRAACDPSGGARDSFTLSICHDEGDVAVLDCLVEIKPPFNPTSATAQMAETLKAYKLTKTIGDRYAAAWVVDAFAKVGIRYEHSERDRSAAYLEALPLFTSGRVRLLDRPKLVAQFAALERRTSPIGKDRVDHGPGGHDDLCNAVALALSTKGAVSFPISDALLARAHEPDGRQRHTFGTQAVRLQQLRVRRQFGSY
jgi:hypothetical protein